MTRIKKNRELGGRSPASEGNLSLETIANNEKLETILEIPEVSKEEGGNNWISVSGAEILVNSRGLWEPSSNIYTLDMERKHKQQEGNGESP